MCAPSAENTDYSSNFVISSNDRVNLALLSKRRQVHSVLLQSIESLLRRLGLHTPVASCLLDGRLESRFGEIGLLENPLNVGVFQES
jgi:hypothetical protein